MKVQFINDRLMDKYAKWIAVEDMQRENKMILINLRRDNEQKNCNKRKEIG
jgi:hypothetical protein